MSQRGATLEVVGPDGKRRVIQLTARPVILGRAPECDVVVDEAFVSGYHARIEPDGNGFLLKDAGSTNGTWLDGSPVNGGRRLTNGASVILGRPGNYSVRFVNGPPSSRTSVSGTNRDLREVFEISKVLLSTLDLEEVLQRVLEASLRILSAERGYLFLCEGADLKLRASRDEGQGQESPQAVEFSRSVAVRVAQSGQAEFKTDLEDNAAQDKSASIIRLRLQSIACVPLKTQQRVIGIVYLDSHRATALPNATGREVLEVLAGLAAVAIENARLVEEKVQNERWTTIGRMAASIVHDIRSPLAALRGTAELLRGKVPDPEHKQKLNLIIAEVDRLSKLSGEMLEFSSDSRPLKQTGLSLDGVVRDFLRTIEPRLVQEKIHLERRLDFAGELMLDSQKLARLLHNVVGNALESMEPGGRLTVETQKSEDGAVLAITDDGCGMDEETAARVFEPFFSHGKERGVGLGMAIVRRIAEQHGASISIRSRAGYGTRVEFLFPVPSSAAAAR